MKWWLACFSMLYFKNGLEPSQKKPHTHFPCCMSSTVAFVTSPRNRPQMFLFPYQTHPDKEQARLEQWLLSSRFECRGFGRKIKGFTAMRASLCAVQGIDCDIDCIIAVCFSEAQRPNKAWKWLKESLLLSKTRLHIVCLFVFCIQRGFAEEWNGIRNVSQPRFAGCAAQGT